MTPTAPIATAAVTLLMAPGTPGDYWGNQTYAPPRVKRLPRGRAMTGYITD